MIILGLVILVAAVVTGSTSTLFLCGMVVGAAALLGLSLVLTGTRRATRRGSTAHRGLEPSARESAVAEQERSGPIDERHTTRAQTDDADPAGPVRRPRRNQHWFHRRTAPR